MIDNTYETYSNPISMHHQRAISDSLESLSESNPTPKSSPTRDQLSSKTNAADAPKPKSKSKDISKSKPSEPCRYIQHKLPEKKEPNKRKELPALELRSAAVPHFVKNVDLNKPSQPESSHPPLVIMSQYGTAPFDAPPQNPNANNNNNPRQTPPPAPGGQAPGNGGGQMNGMGAAARPWPNVGEQMDMNVLWELVNNIAEVHQGIREQTAGVLQRVQMIQARGPENGTGRGDAGGEGGEGERVNGDTGGHGFEPHDSPEAATLRTQLRSAEAHIQSLTAQSQSTHALLSTYESSLSGILDRLRPFAASHETALRHQKAHYLALLDAERTQNLELRLDAARKEEAMQRALGWAREALEEHGRIVRPYVRKIAGLRAENQVLASVCGVEALVLAEESDGSSGED